MVWILNNDLSKFPYVLQSRSVTLLAGSGGERVSGARGHRSFWRPPSFPVPFEVGSLEVSRLKPSGVWGKAPAANDFGAFWDLETLLMTSKIYIFLCTWFVLPCQCLPQQSLQNFCIFHVEKIPHPFLARRPLCWRPGAHAFPLPLLAATVAGNKIISTGFSFFTHPR